MSTATTLSLLGLLEQNETLRERGYSFSRAPSGGIVVDRWGHVHGIWDCDGRCYRWVSPGSSEPAFRTDDAGSAVLYMLSALRSDRPRRISWRPRAAEGAPGPRYLHR